MWMKNEDVFYQIEKYVDKMYNLASFYDVWLCIIWKEKEVAK